MQNNKSGKCDELFRCAAYVFTRIVIGRRMTILFGAPLNPNVIIILPDCLLTRFSICLAPAGYLTISVYPRTAPPLPLRSVRCRPARYWSRAASGGRPDPVPPFASPSATAWTARPQDKSFSREIPAPSVVNSEHWQVCTARRPN